jgi:hypothetical protein
MTAVVGNGNMEEELHPRHSIPPPIGSDVFVRAVQSRLRLPGSKPPLLQHVAIAVKCAADPCLRVGSVCNRSEPPILSGGTQHRIELLRQKVLEDNLLVECAAAPPVDAEAVAAARRARRADTARHRYAATTRVVAGVAVAATKRTRQLQVKLDGVVATLDCHQEGPVSGETPHQASLRHVRNLRRRRTALRAAVARHAAEAAEAKVCCICFDADANTSVEGCGHRFCAGCITKWCFAYEESTCPICRREVRRVDDLKGIALYTWEGHCVPATDEALDAFKAEQCTICSDGDGAGTRKCGVDLAAERCRRNHHSVAVCGALDCGTACDAAGYGTADDAVDCGEEDDNCMDGASLMDVEQRLIQLNAHDTERHHGAGGDAEVVAATNLTTNIIASAVARAATDGNATHGPHELPHERAALRGVDEAVRATPCRCACCGYTCAFGLHLGRAHEFEYKQLTMWGAAQFEGHAVATMIMMAHDLLEEHGWSSITIPFCDRDYFHDALDGSGERAEAAAQRAWAEAELNSVAAAAVRCAVELPFVEQAPCMQHAFADGVAEVRGTPLAFLCLDRAHVLEASAKLRRLCAARIERTCRIHSHCSPSPSRHLHLTSRSPQLTPSSYDRRGAVARLALTSSTPHLPLSSVRLAPPPQTPLAPPQTPLARPPTPLPSHNLHRPHSRAL